MSTENLRFPCGVTVQQAKKDAKFVAKHMYRPLHECLDMMAFKMGFKNGWAKAIADLTRRARPETGRFELPLLGGGCRRAAWSSDTPFIVIAGVTASGKTMLALELARQALEQGLPVRYVSPYTGTVAPGLEHSQRYVTSLSKVERFQLHTIESKHQAIASGRLSREYFQRGGTNYHFYPYAENAFHGKSGLLILDEADSVAGLPDTAEKAAEWVSRNPKTLVVLCLQEPARRGALWDSLDAPIGLRFEGLAHPVSHSDAPGRRDLLKRARDLTPRPGEYSEFVVAERGMPWAETVRLPLPELAAW